MNIEIKRFLKDLETQNPRKHFLFYKLYLKPSDVLGGSEEETLEKYYKYGNTSDLILDNDFLEFLDLCLNDDDFTNKLNSTLLQKIKYILLDSKEYVQQYIIDLESPQFRAFFENRVPLGKKYCKKYNFFQLLELSDLYKRVGWIYDLNLDKEKKKEYDINLTREIISSINVQERIYEEKNIKPKIDREIMLLRIATDNYADINSCLLYLYDGHSKKTFPALICDNEFVDIVETDLLNKELSDIIIEHIIDILDVSINFKTMNDCYADFELYYNMIGKQKIAGFNHTKAAALIDKLTNRKPDPERKRFKLI